MVYIGLEEDCCSDPGPEALPGAMSQWEESPPQSLHGWFQPRREEGPKVFAVTLDNVCAAEGKKSKDQILAYQLNSTSPVQGYGLACSAGRFALEGLIEMI